MSEKKISHSPLPVGEILDGKYRVKKVLGRGSMGIVYFGIDEVLERDVAIKVLLPKYAADAKVAKRFKLEAISMGAARTENVVQIYSYGEYGEHPYFVMEYVPGYTVGNLIDRINEKGEQVYLDVALGILRQVCKGLEAVHALGIVHRDVKPANMLIGPNFRVAITDFGLVETISTLERDLAGTPLYLAPELIRKEKLSEDLRYRSDLYSLAIASYEILTGDVPFDGTSIKEILRKHLHGRVPPITALRQDLPEAINAVFEKALAKNPADRHPNCRTFLEELEEARNEGKPGETKGWPKILIVDDDATSRTIYQTAIKMKFPSGNVVVASDGFQGWELARALSPDLMIIDLNMPGMNGFELIATLHGDELFKEIPLVITSATIDDGNKRVLQILGVQHFLTKPVEPSRLAKLVSTLLAPPE